MATRDQRAERLKKRLAAADETFEKLSDRLIDPSRIEFIDENDDSAEGGYGEVHAALLYPPQAPASWLSRLSSLIFKEDQRQEGVMVAVKQLKMGTTKAHFMKFKPAFARELSIWSQLNHRCVAEFYGFWTDFTAGKAWLISPWAPYGSVRDFVACRDLCIPERISLIYDTVDGLKYLHSQSVCHGDIKAANVLVNAERRAVLCDLGLARLHDENFTRLESTGAFSKGSIRWCSPELLNDQPRSPQTDMWAWAWLVWEIMTGRLPYHESKADYAVFAKIAEARRPEIDNNIQLAECAELWDLMDKCWQPDPTIRPTSADCRNVVSWMPRCPPLAHATGNSDRGKVASLLLALGDTYRRQARFPKALSLLHEALGLYREVEDQFGIAESLFIIADIPREEDRWDEAAVIYEEALEIYRKLDNQPRIASCLHFLGDILRQQGNPESTGYLEEALKVYRSIDQQNGDDFHLPLIADIVRLQGRWEEAVSLLARALVICQETGDQDGAASCLWSIGDIRRLQHRYEEALPCLDESLVLYRKIANADGVGKAIAGIGNIQRVRGQFSEAIPKLEESLVINRRINNRVGIATGLWALGGIHRWLGHVEEAKEFLKDAETNFAEIGNKVGADRCLEELEVIGSPDESGTGSAGPGTARARKGDREETRLFSEEWGQPLRSRPLPRSNISSP
ncbi:hypothetical protein M407DRAFT_34284 [Tulasnella calospora MUT 4182]|uniref:Protein kinase domain-containing protein n=1 Tax=Tulasnella calospora MUT 4182 TaxID=1051891 RepID=A0A0C3L2W9_9AGAM|nr:hypothetical protein M407DRAFT_34284 [Tulasnella calospora MUT 4182]